MDSSPVRSETRAKEGALMAGRGAAGRDPEAGAGARKKLEEALGKLDISEEEATPLVLDDRIEGGLEKWLFAGKVLHQN